MGNVVEIKPEEDNRGYLLSGDKKVTGVYVESLAAMVDYDNVYIGTKGVDGIDDALLTTKDDLNDFCVMWLAIFNPEVLKYDK